MSKHILFEAGKLAARYDGAIHGERKLQVIDPEFEWPMIEVPNPEFYPEASDEEETTLIQDPSVTPPMILVDNPDCTIPADAIEVSEELFFRTINEEDGVWTLNADGSITKEPLPPPSAEQIAAAKIGVIQWHMDAAAKAKGYDDIKSAALRAGLPNSPFHDEGVAFGEWMDSCWAAGYEIMAEVNAGTRPIPSDDELIAALPVLVLPS